MTQTVSTPDRFASDWEEWHDSRERTLKDPLGWLSINRLEWLDSDLQRFDGLPGTWWTDGETAHVTASDHETFADQTFTLHPTGAGEVVELAGVHVEVARRGAGYLIRIHDPEASTLAAFRGVPAFEPDAAWQITGRFEPYSEPRDIAVGAVAEGLEHVYVSPGDIVLEHDGAAHRLIAFNGHSGGLSILFTDATSGVSTYAANRSLAIDASDDVIQDGGDVLLDFNRATNLPCAFIDFATCPLPPAGNTLPFAVTAGEKTPYERN
jgi:uncharacterized protein (DUF1684 family)